MAVGGEAFGELRLMIAHEEIVCDDDKRFAERENLDTSAGAGVADYKIRFAHFFGQTRQILAYTNLK